MPVLYVVPEIEPEPFSLHDPPDGEPTTGFVLPSQIAAVLVVFDAAPGFEFTVKLLSAVVAPQVPLAATVYLIVTVVFDVTLAGV